MHRHVSFAGLLLAMLCTQTASAQGNPCEQTPDSGGTGCGVPKAVFHSTGVSGGISLAATDFDNRCATGTNGCTVLQPPLRFWQQDSFDSRNSGSALQTNPGTEWMINPALDFPGSRPETDVWVLFQANWSNQDVQGCVAGGERTVAELSFCDSAGDAWYVVGSVPDSGDLFDFDSIRGGTGADANIMQLARVPLPSTHTPAENNQPTPDHCRFSVALEDPLAWYSENGLNDAANTLVAGYEIVYQYGATTPTPSCETGLGPWLPVRDPLDSSAPLGAVQPGASVAFSLPYPPTLSDAAFLSVRVVYADSETGCAPGACPDPETQGSPASCFQAVYGPLACPETAVDFASASAERVRGRSVEIRWSTVSERDSYGFVVTRRAEGESQPLQIGGVVLATGSGSHYLVTDLDAAPNRDWLYTIEEIALSGAPSSIGPLRVEARGAGLGRRQRAQGN